MKTYDVHVSWTMEGTVRVQAESKEMAVAIANCETLPKGSFKSGSFKAHPESAREIVK